MDDIAQAYTVLELEPGASLSDVNQAYKDLVFIWHPDRIPADNVRLRDKAQDKLKRLNEARGRLKQYLRSGAPAGKAKSSNYNPERYGSSRYRPYSQGRYTRPYGYSNGSGNGTATTAKDGGRPNAYTSANGSPSVHTNGSPPKPSAATNGQSATNGSKNGSANGTAAGYGSNGRGSSSNGRRSSNGSSGSNGRSSSNGSSSSSYNPVYRHSSDNSYADYIYRAPQPSQYSAPQNSRSRGMPDLEGSDFKGANLKEKDFSGRNLSKSNLEGADLSDAFLHKVNLNQANLHKAKLFRANLLQANLSHANLRESNLIGADLSGADLSGADLSGAVVGYGDKIMVKLTAARLTGTIMPNGNIHE